MSYHLFLENTDFYLVVLSKYELSSVEKMPAEV